MQIAFFDLDKTLLSVNSSVRFCRFLYRKGVFSYKDLFWAVVYYLRYALIDNSLERLHRSSFQKLLRGKNILVLQDHVEEFWNAYLAKLLYLPAFLCLQKALQAKNLVFLFSSAPDFLIKPLVARWQLSGFLASEYLLDNDHCLWEIAHICQGKDKAEGVQRICHMYQVDRVQTIAYSDSILDLPFLLSVGSVVVVKPDYSLKKVAKQYGWKSL